MQYVAEQVGPAQNTAGGVDDLVIEDAIVVDGVRHQREHGNLAAIARHERAEGQAARGMRAAVLAGDGHVAMVFRREQILDARHEIRQPTDVLLEFRIGVVDHQGIEADARDDQERMAMIGGFVIEQGETADVHLAGAMRGGHGQGGVDVIHGNAHIAREQVAGADRDDAHGMAGAGHGARDRADSAVAADRDHHVGAVGECLLGACAAVLVELRVDEVHLRKAFRLAEFPDMPLTLVGLRLRRVDDEYVMHLVVAALVKLTRQLVMSVRAHAEEGGDAHCGHADDDEQRDDNGHRHVSHCHRK